MFINFKKQYLIIISMLLLFLLSLCFQLGQVVTAEETPIAPEMILVPAGASTDYLDLRDVQQDYDFYLGKFMVTNQDYVKFLNEAEINLKANLQGKLLIDIENEYSSIGHDGTEFHLKSRVAEAEQMQNLARHPVTYVSWYGAIAYCNWLSEEEGLEPAYDLSTWDLKARPEELKGYRLPTISEWQYAARGGEFGNETIYAGSNQLEEVGWYWDNSEQVTNPVGAKKPNELGLYDMTGNAWEWTTTYEGKYYATRGGGWSSSEFLSKFSFRGDCKVHQTYGDLGFRLARTRR